MSTSLEHLIYSQVVQVQNLRLGSILGSTRIFRRFAARSRTRLPARFCQGNEQRADPGKITGSGAPKNRHIDENRVLCTYNNFLFQVCQGNVRCNNVAQIVLVN